MGVQAVDYRVSTLVVLCKDCSQDVGLYPARHKCMPIDRPAMPSLPSKYQKSNQPTSIELNARTMSSGSTSSNTSASPSPSFSSVEQPTSKWSSRLGKSSVATSNQDQHEGDGDEDSVYFNNFATNLPGDQPSGKKLWGKIKQNDKWKQLSEKNDKPKPPGKLWGKLMQATQTMADKIPNRDDRGAESDEDDWEGETHTSRILREYYEKKQMRLPEWLFDDDTPKMSRKHSSRGQTRDDDAYSNSRPSQPVRTPSRRKLWEQSPDDSKNISSRERERQELRQAQPPPPPVPSSARSDRYSHEDRYSNRSEDRYNNNSARDYSRQDDRYSHEDRYDHHRDITSNRSMRDEHYGNRNDTGRHRDNDDYYRNSNNSNDRHYDNRYEDKSSRRDDYREPPPSRAPDRRRYHDEPVDNYYKRPQSPPRQQPQARSKSSNSNYNSSRPRYYDDDIPSSVAASQPPPRSERSARGFQREAAPKGNSHSYNDRGNELDDYYYNAPPERSSGRRYNNNDSSNYF